MLLPGMAHCRLDMKISIRCTYSTRPVVLISTLAFLYGLLATSGAQSPDDITDIRLGGGPADAPNSGRVEVLHGPTGLWLTVCDVNVWGDNDGEVACRQLGFPGYSRIRGESYFGEGTNNGSVGGIGCNGDEDRLGQCPHQPVQESTGCNGRAAGLICTAPGFLGCFIDMRDARVFPSSRFTSGNMTIGLCLKHCRGQGVRYAGLENRRDCYCGDEGTQIDIHGKLGDRDCRTACMGNPDEVCGGRGRLSIYDVNLGYCTDPGTPADGGREPAGVEAFRYGTNVTFYCNDGFDLLGADLSRCVLGASPQEVVWDKALPQCRSTYVAISTTQDPAPNADDERVGLGAGKIAGMAVACLILFILILLAVIFIRKRRHKVDKNANKALRVQDGNAYSAPHHTPSHQTSADTPSTDTEYQDLTLPSSDADRPYTSLKKRAPEEEIPEYLELDENTTNARASGADADKRPVGAMKAGTLGKQQLPSPEIDENEYSYVNASSVSGNSQTLTGTGSQPVNDEHKYDGQKQAEEYAELDSVYYSLPSGAR